MLKLTVLLRYSEGKQKIYDILGTLEVDFETREIVSDMSTETLNCKYLDMKEIICNSFTSDKSKKEVFRKIRDNGMKMAKAKFPYRKGKSEGDEFVILIQN